MDLHVFPIPIPLPPPAPPDSSGSSQCTRPKHLYYILELHYEILIKSAKHMTLMVKAGWEKIPHYVGHKDTFHGAIQNTQNIKLILTTKYKFETPF